METKLRYLSSIYPKGLFQVVAGLKLEAKKFVAGLPDFD
jgi:hypothetical protein